MATYLLLRNNKNSGPYSLEALIQLGLKPYDLVWVEGKSAAWRYPSEVEDLKFYAPAVEEQPYDRFYKKPAETSTGTEKQQAVVQEVKPVEQEVNFSQPEEVKQSTKNSEIKTPRKQVFVSLPANTGNTIVKKPEPVVAAIKAPEEIVNYHTNPVKKTEASENPSYSELVSEYNSYLPLDKKIQSGGETLSLPKKQTPVETKYSQSLDDIKDIYVQTLADRKRKTAQKKMMMKVLKRGLPFAAVLLLGFVMGGYLMNRKAGPVSSVQPLQNNFDKLVLKKEENKDAQPATVTPQQQEAAPLRQPENTASPLTNETAANGEKTGKKENATEKNNTAQLPLNVVKKFVAKQNETAKTASDASSGNQQPQNIEADPRTGERNKIVRSGTEPDNGNANTIAVPGKNGLLKQVNVKGNEYKVGTFGGIHDLELTVVNNSNFLLDHVMVELQYLKPSDQPLKTNNVQFNNVPPNGSLTLAIPATNRGIKVVYKVINVQSKAAGYDTAGL